MKTDLKIYLASCITAAALALPAAAQSTAPETEYTGQNYCGVVSAYLFAPTASVVARVVPRGELERFVATWGSVERQHQRAGSVPPVWETIGTVYDAHSSQQYTCPDLLLADLDADGDLDMVYATPREVAILENRQGSFHPTQVLPLDLDARTAVQLSLEPGREASHPQIVVRSGRRRVRLQQ